MKFYKKSKKAILTITSIQIFCIIVLVFAVRFPTQKLILYWLGLIGGLIWITLGLPLMLTWTIAIDDEAVYTLYSLFGRVLHIRKKILFKDIRFFSVNGIGWFTILPVQDSDKYRLRDTIIIQKDIKNYAELVNKILTKLDPAVVDERVKICLAGKLKRGK